jgi:PKD repeat protein
MRRLIAFASLVLTMVAIACGGGDDPTAPSTSPSQPTSAPHAMAPAPSFATASNSEGLLIATDKDDYSPGDTVWFTGAGWPANDTLDIVLIDDPQTHPPHTWAVHVAADGSFRDSTYVVDIGDLGVTFTLTATSRSDSTRALTVIFYDFNLANAFINTVGGSSTQGGVVHSGSSFNITAGATRTNSGGNVTIPTWAGTSYAFNTTNSAPSGGSFTCLSPANPSPAVSVNAIAAPGTSGGTMPISTNGLARGTQYLFIQAHATSNCSGNSTPPSGGWPVVVQGPDVAITKSHTPADFVRGADANYTIVVQNVGEDPTSGTITVADNLPNNLTATAIAGSGWSCTLSPLGCTMTGPVNAGASANSITLTVEVGKSGNNTVTNTATVSGGGDNTAGNNTANDPTTLIDAPPTHLEIATSAFSTVFNTCSSVITVRTRNQFNQPVRPDANVQVNLTSTSGGGSFYTTADCSGSAVTAVTIPSTDFKVNFYYKDSACGSPTIKAKDNVNPGLGEDTQTETVTGCASNSPPTVNAGGPYTVAEGTELTLSPTVTDPDAADVLTYTWSIAYTTPIDANGSCNIVGAATKNAKITCNDDSNNGSFTVTLEVGDGHGHTVPDDATLTVTNVKPDAHPGSGYSGSEGTAIQLSGSGTDVGANDAISSYSWTVDDSGIVDGGSCSLSAANIANPTVTCNDNGSVKVALTVTDDENAASTASQVTIPVANVNPEAHAGGPYSGSEGTSIQLGGSGTDAGANDVIASYSWSVDNSGIDSGGSCGLSATNIANPTLTCNDNGMAKVSLTVTDDDGGTSSASEATVTVSNVAPSISSLSITPVPAAINMPVNLSAQFSDPGSNDTHTATIDWDDGNSVDPGPISSGSVSKSHPYSAAGIYTVKLTVSDDDTGSDTEIFEYAVVYDPSAGFVTGGGWINSPLGAYVADPYLSGKATFGFVSKYLKGANTPTGNTEFQFHAAGMNFSSTSYEWLVVQGSNRATYKGYGTINGSGEYGFLLAAYDGGTLGDRFRIKIWVKSTKAVVYDNEIGTSDDAIPTTTISSGSIVIHVPKK